MAQIKGNSRRNLLRGTRKNDVILGLEGNDRLFGALGNDRLTGGLGNDLVNGGRGADTLVGSQGNDIYVVDNIRDRIRERRNQGIDTVQSSVSLTLNAHLENLTLTGTANLNATGNASNNILVGNSGNNLLDGRAGADQMSGGLGDDTYLVSESGDRVIESINAGSDRVRSLLANYTLTSNVENLELLGTANINGTGNTLSNTITGNSGNNTLDGGQGIDRLVGEAGNDLYIVDNLGDVVIEFANGGIDTVRTTFANYTLPDNVEFLEFIGTGGGTGGTGGGTGGTGGGTGGTGSGTGGTGGGTGGTGGTGGNTGGTGITAIGNALDNTILGTIGNDTIDGGLGIDQLIGGLGNDTYLADQTADFVNETVDGGIDLVKAASNYVLGENVENLELLGSSNLEGTGNALANTITGNSGNNILRGGLGNDSLLGGAGVDTLIGGVGTDTLTGGAGVDTFVLKELDGDLLTDFNPLEDKIALDQTAFGLTGVLGSVLSASNFQTVANDAAAAVGATLLNPLTRIIYSSETGKLFYDANSIGAGLGNGGLIATLSTTSGLTPVLANTSFVINSLV